MSLKRDHADAPRAAADEADPAPLPLLLLTQGDPAGIGPEVALRAALAEEVRATCRPVLVGLRAVFERAAAAIGRADLAFVPAGAAEGVAPAAVEETPPSALPLVVAPPEDGLPDLEEMPWGTVGAAGGRAAAAAVSAAATLCAMGGAAGMVTAPLNKEALALGGVPHPGHTEMLAAQCGGAEVAMMLVGGGLRVVLATIHEPLARVPSLITRERLARLFALLDRELTRRPLAAREPGVRPRVAVCGLNPHAGEGGLFGTEERDTIGPAIAAARAAHPRLEFLGPLPADTAFHRARRGDADLVVAMYHDQGLAPLKTVAFEEGVNVTLGLPIVRTSPDHGTAYDLAGSGRADPRSMIAAVLVAAAMAHGTFPPALTTPSRP